MLKLSLVKFENLSSTGINSIPNGTMVYIEDSDGSGNPLMLSVLDTSGLTQTTTIYEFLNDATRYKVVTGGSGELVKVSENGKTGWRLFGRNPDNYTEIGEQALDFSFSDTPQNVSERGAKGNFSTAFGYNTFSNAHFSVAIGKFNIGKTNTLFEVGNGIDINNLNNVFEIEDTGLVKAPGMTLTDIHNAPNNVLITKEYLINGSFVIDGGTW